MLSICTSRTWLRRLPVLAILLAVAVLVSLATGASARDLHRLWDNLCAECHGHSGDFARQFLSVSDGELRGHHHVHDLRKFLANHYPPSGEVDAVYRMLLAQVNTPPRFKEECERCHATAAEFARASMYLMDDVIFGRESGQPIRQFLVHHRRLQQADVDFFSSLLERVVREIGRP